jgi:hypothetical protein
MIDALQCRWLAVLLIGCAWMLWERSWSSIGTIGNQWEVAGAYDSRQACETVRPERIRRAMVEYQEIAKAIGGTVEQRHEVVYLVTHGPAPSRSSTTYTCVPDSIDPRSSKP